MSDDRPMSIQCERCECLVEVTSRVETEPGEYGGRGSSWLEFSVEPACPGYAECHRDERFVAYHQAGDMCEGPDTLPSCPFDNQDERYYTSEVQSVMAVRRDRQRYGRAE